MANEFIARNGIISKSNLVVSGSLTALSTITAQTLVVQTITSSISSITGSTNFGSLAINTHSFTGSMSVSGSGTFSSTITSLAASGQATIIAEGSATNGEGAIQVRGKNSSGTSRSAQIKYDNSDIIRIGTSSPIGMQFETSDAVRLSISSTGTATFSSTVTATSLSVVDGGLYPRVTVQSTNAGSSAAGYNFADNSGVQWAIAYDKAGSGLQFFKEGSGNRMYITNTGNVGIGTSSPSGAAGLAFVLNSGASQGRIVIKTSSTGDASGAGLQIVMAGVDASIEQRENAALTFATNAAERMRITSGGQIVNTFTDANNPYVFNNTGTNPYGPWFKFTTDSNNNSNYYWVASAVVSGVEYVRAKMLSNGGLANYQANNTNLSDERTKKDIIPLESYWDKFKDIEIVKFKYKDQTHDDFNIGVIAQQVEAVAPEFVDADGWDNKPKLDEEGNQIISNEEPLKSIYTADLHHATIKVLQEAITKIETLEARVQELENK
jgi:uncharacterized protein YaiE (UPF0345 family)